MLVTAGGMRIDSIITHDGRAHLGLLGGNALYSAAGASIWIDDIAVWARIGQNYPVEWLPRLERHGLNIEGLVKVKGSQEHQTFYAYGEDGRRHDTDPSYHFSRIGLPLPQELKNYVHSTPGQDDPLTYEPLALRPADWPARFDRAIAVHLAPLSIRTHVEVATFLRDRGIKWLSVDPGERYMRPQFIPEIRRFLPTIDVFLPSYQELVSLFGSGVDVVAAVRKLAEWGTPLIIVKLGAEGVLIYSKKLDKVSKLAPYHRPGDKRVIDVTGAGDSFCGGFLAGLHQGMNPEESVKMGMVSASLAVEGYGVRFASEQPVGIGARRLQAYEERFQKK
jgi:ribokinase